MTGSLLLMPRAPHLSTVSVSTAAPKSVPSQTTGRNTSAAVPALRSLTGWALYPVYVLAAVFITAFIMYLTSSLAGMESIFSRCWSLAMNIAPIDWGVRQLVWGVLVTIRGGVGAFPTGEALVRAVPSLAWLAPGANAKLALILSTIDPFTAWSTVLIALAMTEGLKLNVWLSWVVALAYLLFPALLVAAFGAVQ